MKHMSAELTAAGGGTAHARWRDSDQDELNLRAHLGSS